MSAITKKSVNHEQQGTYVTYIIGFVLSLVLTLTAYVLVVNTILTGSLLVAAICVLAVLQLLVQLVFFLHLGKETGPRWNLFMFGSMLMIVGIVVIGSLWIMHNLNYNMMPAGQMDQHMMKEKDKGF